ncbi:MAG: type I glutamate--ammonia ligase [Chloroflexi bacterium HGW-Chloroflexi-8]|nr:MAG: type I glutamate--ammonia ligase [Chloroflexi bacterium HGW-Chloroflexi-8]
MERVKADGVHYVSLQFTDVTGTVKSVDAPVKRLEEALDEGVWFDGSSVQGFVRIQESDMHLIIDTDTYAVLPWSPEENKRARFFCEIYHPDGRPFEGDPRGVLKRKLETLKSKNIIVNIGPEPEFFLFRKNGGDFVNPVPHDVGGYFDFSPNDEAVRVRTELMTALTQMGLEVEVGHHECALAQHEIDFRFDEALKTADNVLTLKYTVKAIAAQHGLVASFMPKPIFGENGSGMHCHQSLFDLTGENLFYDPKDDFHLSTLAYQYIAGQLNHARGMSAILSPSVNSYKRLVPGYEAPVYIGWAGINRSALIRIPRINPGKEKAARVELRCPDPSGNPYLQFAAMIQAGMDGVERKMTPPKGLNKIDIYTLSPEERVAMGIRQLPGSLMEALDELEKDSVIRNGFGEDLYNAFMRAKRSEWDEYRIHVTDWEKARYLETA